MREMFVPPWWLPWIVAGFAASCGADSNPGETATAGATEAVSTTGDMSTDAAPTVTGDDASATDTSGDLPETPTVPCSECFPLEQLPDDLRAQAEDLLLLALDREALYTIAADIKPMSSGFAELSYPADGPTPPELEALRTIVAAFTCTPELTASVQVFHATFDGVAYSDGVVFHVPRVRETVEAFADLFAAIGIAADEPPLAVVDAVDADPTTRRFRGYGHLFGYPEYAVDFFAEAAEHEAMTGEFVEREFIHIPTFESAEGRFVYAVPVGHQENDDDVALRARAAPVLAHYAELRTTFIGDDKPGVLPLVRTWFDDGSGRCSPRHALMQVDR
ncbi:hypothetical protein [Nannocystis punicea]|uniref:Uncharacterized protein n=1 Tax=Nannocystis punicea TaxID=2995304 RepID=A0ABY7GY08_9BACT|nr:hypothetical protein [Nannocystis poenicansa]WAS91868.1 hypothetical protein O0S08_37275 [Nannocystis poenicansa]